MVPLLFLVLYFHLKTGLDGDFFFFTFSLSLVAIISSVVFFVYATEKGILDTYGAVALTTGSVVFFVTIINRFHYGASDPASSSLIIISLICISYLIYKRMDNVLYVLLLNGLLVLWGGILLLRWIPDWVFFLLLAGAVWIFVSDLAIPREATISLMITCLGVAVLTSAFMLSGGKLIPHEVWESISIRFTLQTHNAMVFDVEGPAVILSGSTFYGIVHLTDAVVGAAIYVLGRENLSRSLESDR